MPRPRGGAFTKEASVPVAVRLPNDVYQAAVTAAGGPEGLPEWLRRVIHAATMGKLPGLGAAQTAGYEEGKRQGWAHANKLFREALKVAADKLHG